MGTWKPAPVPALGTFKGKMTIVKASQNVGVVSSSKFAGDQERLKEYFTEADATVTLNNGVCVTTLSSGELNSSFEMNYVVGEGGDVYTYMISSAKVSPATLAAVWNPFAPSWATLTNDSLVLTSSSPQMPFMNTLAKQP